MHIMRLSTKAVLNLSVFCISVLLLMEMLSGFVAEGVTDLPLADTRVVDMSLGHDGICQSLLRHVLAIEQPEFESQKQSLNNDVAHLRREIAHEQVENSLARVFSYRMSIISSG